MNDKQAAEFEATKECNFAIAPAGIGRFRVNAFVQMGAIGLVLRVITTTIPDFDKMGLPPVLKDVVMSKRGLIIFVGGTGSGKTTLLNAMSKMIDHGERVVTIEDAAELQLQQEHVVRLETRPNNVEGKGRERVAEKKKMRHAAKE